MATLRDKNHKFGGSLQALKSAVELLEEQIIELPEASRANFQKICNLMVEGLIRVEIQAEDLKAISYRFIKPDLDVEDVLSKIRIKNSDQKILLVEDDEIMTEIMPKYLEKSGYRVSVVSDVESAKEAIIKEKPAVVIADLFLGKSLGGIEILRFIKENHAGIKCIIQTRMDDKEVIKKVQELAPDKIIFKPFSLRNLETQINGLLTQSSQDI
jgi:CheY-like chemotaxis protein